jgi:hypothetical protein
MADDPPKAAATVPGIPFEPGRWHGGPFRVIIWQGYCDADNKA